MTTYFDDTFTGTLDTLLDAHTADTGGGYTKLGSTAMTDNLSGDGFAYRKTAGAISAIYKSTTAIAVADYQVDLTFKVKSILASDIVVAYGRVTDVNNYYEVDCSQNGTLSLRKKTTAGGLVTLAAGSTTLNAGDTHKLSLRLVGSTLTMLLDDVVVTATSGANPVTDTTFAGPGSTGVQVGHATSTAESTTTGLQADRLTAADPPAAPVNTVAPVVSGTRVVGQTLTTTNGTWTGSPSSFPLYDWQRDGTTIGAANANTYVLQAGDAGHTVRCAVTAHNTSGDSAAAPSNGLVIVAELVAADITFNLAAGGGLGGSPAAAIPTPTSVYDAVTFPEAQAGDTEYRVVYLKNTHALRSLTGTVLWIDTQTTSPTTDLAVGVAVEAAGSDVTAIADEETSPAGVTFSAPASLGAGIAIGTLGPGQARGVWLKWHVLPDTADLASDACILAWDGTPA